VNDNLAGTVIINLLVFADISCLNQELLGYVAIYSDTWSWEVVEKGVSVRRQIRGHRKRFNLSATYRG
jgi:hypothetical protein